MGKIRIRSRYRGRIPQTIAESASGVDTPTVQITGAGGSDYPNEPAGLTRICEHDYSVMPGVPGGGTTNYGYPASGPAGSWWNSGSANFALGSEGSETYLRIKFPTGLPVGNGPGTFVGWGPNVTDGANVAEYGDLYIYQRFRFIGPPGDETTWQMNANGTKMNYTPHAYNSTFAMSFLMARPVPGIAIPNLGIRSQYRIVNYQKWCRVDSSSPTGCSYPWVSSAERSANVNAPAATLNVGEWVEVEQVFNMNPATCPPTQSGRWRMWINGTLTHDYTNWSFRALEPDPEKLEVHHGFRQYRFAPIFGGVYDHPRERDDYLDVAHSYVSGVPL